MAPTSTGLFGLPFIITTRRRATDDQRAEAVALAQRTGQPYVDREHGSVPTLIEYAIDNNLVSSDVTGVLVVRQHEYRFWPTEGEEFQYHPGMAVHRIKALSRGAEDPMIQAMNLGPGDSVLDCTAGLCSDALVAAHVVGDAGKVLGLEASLPVALVVRKGLQTYETKRKDIVPAMRRLQVTPARAEDMLPHIQQGAWDIVYFDPMFVDPVAQSVGIAPLRRIADPSPLTMETLIHAARIASRAVVIKDRVGGPWISSTLHSHVVRGANRRVGYAVIEAGKLSNIAKGEPSTRG